MVRASLWVGLTLPGMIDEPGSFSGMRSSPIRPADRRRTSARRWRSSSPRRQGPQRADDPTSASCADSAANLSGAPTNGLPVSAAIRAAARSPNRGSAFSPVPTAVPPSASSYSAGRLARIPARAASSWAAQPPSLADRDRGRVLEVGSPEHHDVGVGLGLRPEGVTQRLDGRADPLLEDRDRREVHDRREGVVRRLGPVHVVVRVDRPLARRPRAGQLVGPAGDDLVGVHVRLGPRARLEHDQRELVIEPPVDHLARRGLDERGLVGRQLTQLAIGLRRAELERPERPDDRAIPVNRPTPIRKFSIDRWVWAPQ